MAEQSKVLKISEKKDFVGKSIFSLFYQPASSPAATSSYFLTSTLTPNDYSS